MRVLVLLLTCALAPLAHAAAPPDHVCVPTATVAQAGAYAARQPWADVDRLMRALLEVDRTRWPCEPPKAEAKPEAAPPAEDPAK